MSKLIVVPCGGRIVSEYHRRLRGLMLWTISVLGLVRRGMSGFSSPYVRSVLSLEGGFVAARSRVVGVRLTFHLRDLLVTVGGIPRCLVQTAKYVVVLQEGAIPLCSASFPNGFFGRVSLLDRFLSVFLDRLA